MVNGLQTQDGMVFVLGPCLKLVQLPVGQTVVMDMLQLLLMSSLKLEFKLKNQIMVVTNLLLIFVVGSIQR